MADMENFNDEDFMDDDYIVVEMTDDEGNVYPYVQEMVIPVGDDEFALLVPMESDDEGHEEGCDCGCEEDDVIIAKMVKDENGEIEYIEPTDEEFALVEKAYDAMFEDEEDE
ncbi:MAG: DUF1292 domain-containing protein [Selenomonadaceae bacterium]|nr:DUF1292 domain-containing protein [Selenomonadaceae bacterium]